MLSKTRNGVTGYYQPPQDRDDVLCAGESHIPHTRLSYHYFPIASVVFRKDLLTSILFFSYHELITIQRELGPLILPGLESPPQTIIVRLAIQAHRVRSPAGPVRARAVEASSEQRLVGPVKLLLETSSYSTIRSADHWVKVTVLSWLPWRPP